MTRATLQIRTKPLLGTFVEISLPPMPEADFVRLTDFAFTRIADIHRMMSFHEPDSDLGRITRARAGDTLNIAHDTWLVLQTALTLEIETAARFNVAIAPQLVARNVLPLPGNAIANTASTLAAGILLQPNDSIEIRQPVWIDLGGIAKGYAVDAAIMRLQQEGVTNAVVNAGGDLRVIGAIPHKLALRDPQQPNELIDIAQLTNMAAATSGDYFIPHAIVGDGRADDTIVSATVVAQHCIIADALTKVLWLCGRDAGAILKKYEAYGVLIFQDGTLEIIS